MVVIEYISMNTFFNDEKHKIFIIQKLFIILKRGRKKYNNTMSNTNNTCETII